MNALDYLRRGGAAAAVTAGLLFALPGAALAADGSAATLPTEQATVVSDGSVTDAVGAAAADSQSTQGVVTEEAATETDSSAVDQDQAQAGDGSSESTDAPWQSQDPSTNDSSSDGTFQDGLSGEDSSADGATDEKDAAQETQPDDAADSVETPAAQPEAKAETPVYTNQWVNEGGRYFWYDAEHEKTQGWVVTGKRTDGTEGGLQRYWVNADGLASDYLVNGDDAAIKKLGGYWAYANHDGIIVRGFYNAGDGRFYYADNNGLLWDEGWHVANLGQGLQRYYVEADHVMHEGYSSSGWDHYTTSAGYVLRGRTSVKQADSRTYTYLANNDGKLERAGWLVTSAYGQGLQRYYIDSAAHAAVSGYAAATSNAYAHFTTDTGYVLRGVTNAGGRLRWADNDGRLLSSGWLVTSAFGQGLQRYWFVDGAVATEGAYETSTGKWAYATSAGYVLRGALDNGAGHVYLADNDGLLASVTAGKGWIVSSAYGSGLQRYYLETLDNGAQAARSSLFTVDGYGASFGVAGKGYVLRGKLAWAGHVLLADNDGRLANVSGMIVTGAYDGGTLQRYYLEDLGGEFAGFHGAKVGLFTVDGQTHFGYADRGYLERNARTWHGVTYYAANNDGVLVRVDNDYTRTVTAYINWALGIAADDSHGYDQAYRWNERGDFDCSSLVISALRAAGVNTYGASYTGNMRSQLLRGRFQLVFDFSSRKRGDILLADGAHTAIYLGDDQLVHASGNEFGEALGGRPGDQTGKEICVRSYYNRPWKCILRYIDA